MKLTLLFLLFAFTVSAQDNRFITTAELTPSFWQYFSAKPEPILLSDDSVKISVNIQARDVELITALTPYSEEFEQAYDAAKVKFRVQNPPTGNTNVAIDSVMVGTWLKIWTMLKRNPYAIGASADTRVDAVLRAKNNAWLTAKMDAVIADGTAHYNNLKALGRKRLTGK